MHHLPLASLALPLTALATALAAACVDPEPPDDLDEHTAAITNAAGSTWGFAVVVNGGCSGSVIAPRAVVTAGHCFPTEGGTGGTAHVQLKDFLGRVIFDGTAAYRRPASYSLGSAAHDVALIQLPTDPSPAPTSVAIYAGPESPWTGSGTPFTVVGYGFGSNVGGQPSCPEALEPQLSFGIQREGAFTFQGTGARSGSTPLSSLASSPVRTLCHGDSGGPWLLTRNATPYQFAVSSLSYLEVGMRVEGTLLAPHLTWLTSAAAEMGQPLTCSLVRDHRGTAVTYYTCHR